MFTGWSRDDKHLFLFKVTSLHNLVNCFIVEVVVFCTNIANVDKIEICLFKIFSYRAMRFVFRQRIYGHPWQERHV